MPVYWLTDALVFPPPDGASPEGVLAAGGDLSAERLLLAYSQGVFPWPADGLPLLWHCPDPRFVLPLDGAHLSRSLRKAMTRGQWEVRADTAFERVIEACAMRARPQQDGTWITAEMIEAYKNLHRLGFAHSVEAWLDGELAGGLYGISLGGMFFGESMYATVPDASKVAFATLLAQLRRWRFDLVDCQVHTPHLERFGARHWPRCRFLAAVSQSLSKPTRRGPWSLELGAPDAVRALVAAADAAT